MHVRGIAAAAGVAGLVACATAGGTAALAPVDPTVSTACVPIDPSPAGTLMANRPSPYDSIRVVVGGAAGQLCYGRPSMRGRAIFGGLVPFDRLWRTGANEPTVIHLPYAASIAGLDVEPGSYSIYTVPGEREWTVIVNRATSQWGIESLYTAAIEAQEVGRAQVRPEATASPVELFTIRPVATGPSSAELVMEWERTRVAIPISRR